MASRAGRDAWRPAAVSGASMDRPAAGRRSRRRHDDAGARGVERQGQARARLAAGAPIVARRFCRHRRLVARPSISRVTGGRTMIPWAIAGWEKVVETGDFDLLDPLLA